MLKSMLNPVICYQYHNHFNRNIEKVSKDIRCEKLAKTPQVFETGLVKAGDVKTIYL